MGDFTAVGLDVHKRSVSACAIDGRGGQVWTRRFGHDPAGLVGWLRGLPGPLEVVYETGPTGFWLARLLDGEGFGCRVLAASKIPRAPGERVKTDARDARALAVLVAGGVDLSAARVPTLDEEHARDLTRGRDDVRRELARHRQHVDGLLLRRGLVWDGSAWTKGHMEWLARQDMGSPLSRAVYADALGQVLSARSRLADLDRLIARAAAESAFAPVVRALWCLRGVDVLTGFALAVEVGDWSRFGSGRQLSSFLGLVPSEHSSGESRSQGGMAKTGNSHARRLLVEAAWHHARPFNPASVALARRRAERPDPLVRAVADKANRRLAARWDSFRRRGKRAVAANGAIARELACWCWELAGMSG